MWGGVVIVAVTIYFLRKYWKEGNDAIAASQKSERGIVEALKDPMGWRPQETEIQAQTHAMQPPEI
jgi:hypothetical protein